MFVKKEWKGVTDRKTKTSIYNTKNLFSSRTKNIKNKYVIIDFTIDQLINANVYLGYTKSFIPTSMYSYMIGHKKKTVIFNLNYTLFNLRTVLRVVNNIVALKGFLWFIDSYFLEEYSYLKSSFESIFYKKKKSLFSINMFSFMKGPWNRGLLTNYRDTYSRWDSYEPYPQTIFCLSSSAYENMLWEAKSSNILTISVADSSSSPNLSTYVIPGNEKSVHSKILYFSLGLKAITSGILLEHYLFFRNALCKLKLKKRYMLGRFKRKKKILHMAQQALILETNNKLGRYNINNKKLLVTRTLNSINAKIERISQKKATKLKSVSKMQANAWRRLFYISRRLLTRRFLYYRIKRRRRLHPSRWTLLRQYRWFVRQGLSRWYYFGLKSFKFSKIPLKIVLRRLRRWYTLPKKRKPKILRPQLNNLSWGIIKYRKKLPWWKIYRRKTFWKDFLKTLPIDIWSCYYFMKVKKKYKGRRRILSKLAHNKIFHVQRGAYKYKTVSKKVNSKHYKKRTALRSKKHFYAINKQR